MYRLLVGTVTARARNECPGDTRLCTTIQSLIKERMVKHVIGPRAQKLTNRDTVLAGFFESD
jgi:hypothetical protein